MRPGRIAIAAYGRAFDHTGAVAGSSPVWHRSHRSRSQPTASGCAARSTRTRPSSDGELAPDAARGALRAGGLRRARDHRPLEADRGARRTACSCIPSVELNCMLPGARDGHVLGFGVAARPGELARWRAEYADLERDGRLDRRARRRRVPRASLLDGRRLRARSSCRENVAGIEVCNAGCELEVGRGRLVGPLGRAARERAPLLRRSRPTTRTTPASTSGFAWTWVRAAERTPTAVLAALRDGRLLRLARAR